MAAAWQRPYLNIFKHFRVEEWKRSAKEGDVATLMDARLKGTVYRIRGSLPGSSYLQLPRAGTQSLGLVGRYLYLLFKPLPHKHFLVHLDVTTEDRQEVRISFSTLFKEFKFTATWLQFPFVCGAAEGSAAGAGLVGAAPADVRWTCLVLDLPSILSLYLSRSYSHLKSIKLCSNLLVKNLCTSDLLFDPGVTSCGARQAGLLCPGAIPMPREMAFPVPRGRSWHDLYDYIRFPSEASELPFSSIRSSCPEPVAGGQVSADLPCQPVVLTRAAQDRVSLSPHITCPRALPHCCPAVPQSIPGLHLTAPGPPGLPRAAPAEDQELQKQQRLHGARGVEPAAGGGGSRVSPQRGTEGTSTAAQAAQQRLLPDPILKLKMIIGFGGCSTKWALWTQDSAAVVYPCHAVIVTLQVRTGHQRFFIGHTDKVSALAINSSSTLLASTQLGALSVGRLWDFPTGSCLSVFQTHIHSLTSLSLCGSGAVLCGAGRDGHGRTMVVVWNTAQVTCGGEVSVLAKAHTDVDIQTLRFALLDDTRLASCGSANVRLWRLRSGALRSCPLALGHLQLLRCTDLAFHPHHHTLFVSSRSGHVLEVDYRRVCVRSVRRLLPLRPPGAGRATGPGIAINSISISSTFCATGSEDGYLRLWPLDFSAAVLEAGHEAPLSSICISPDSSKVLSTTSTGSLGYLDIQSRDCYTLMRSPHGPVLSFSLQGLREQLATVAQDGSIQVWDIGSMQQLYEFSSAEDMPCAVAFHPTQQILACGFSSGLVQTFSLASSDLLVEHKQHHAVITGLTFSPDGQFMFSSCLQGTLALYSCLAEKSQVLRVLGSVVAPHGGSAAAALALSGDSRLLAFVGPSTCLVTVMEACSLRQLLSVDISTLGVSSTALDSARRLCFAAVPAGELLVSTASSKILVLDAETGQLLRQVSPGHKLCCSALALSTDSRHLLTAAHKAIKVWDYQRSFRGNCQVFIGHSEPVCQVAFTPDQQRVVSVGDAIFLWDFLALPAERSPPAGPCAPRAALLPGAGIFSESDAEEEAGEEAGEEAELLGSRVLWHGDSNALVLESVREEELLVVRPRVRQESFRSPEESADGARQELQSPRPGPALRPGCRRHFAARPTASPLPQSFLSPPAGRELLRLKAVLGYNGNGRGNMVWHPDTGFFAYTCGCLIVVEDLHSGAQSHWLGHTEEISTLAISPDAQVLASASGRRDGDLHCQICIWKVQDGACTARLCHHRTQVQAMAFSRDSRFLVTLGDYQDQSIAVWNTCTHQLLASAGIPQPAHEVAFSPLCPRQLACVGQGALLLWLLEQQGPAVSLKVLQAPAPEVLGPVELTSLCYGAKPLLYCGSSSGQVCVWDTETSCCFMTWEADEGEIGVLLCGHHRLVSGSSTKRVRLWAVGTVQELRLKGPDARRSCVLLERELALDGAVVSAAFDERLELGVVGTAAGTLWYINWAEGSSLRLISGHGDKVTQMCFSPEESLCATCAEDGSLRVWSLGTLELVVQFQVLNQSCRCLAWKPARGAGGQQVVAGYGDGSLRAFSVARAELELKLHPHGPAVTAVAYSTDGEMILSGAEDGLVAVSSPRTGVTIRVLADHRGSPITVLQCTRKQRWDFGLEGSELWLATSWDRRVSVWASDWLRDKCELLDWLSFPAPASPQDLKSLPPSLAAFCPWEPGTLVYVGFGMQKEALFYSLHKKQVVEKVSLPYFATSLSLAPAGRFMAVGFGERLLRLLRCAPGAAQDCAGHDDSVHGCCFSPSGRRLLTASHSAVLLWELTGG